MIYKSKLYNYQIFGGLANTKEGIVLIKLAALTWRSQLISQQQTNPIRPTN